MELFASDEQHVLDLYCSKGKNCSYKFYWPSFRVAYENPRFSKSGKGYDQGGLQTFPYGPVFPRLGTPWGQRVLANPHGQADYQLNSVT